MTLAASFLGQGGGGGGGGGACTPLYKHRESAAPTGRVFAPFWSENGYRFCPLWSDSGMGFKGTTGVYEPIYCFNSK